MNQELISVISAFFGSLGFSIIYNIRGLRIWIPAIEVLFSGLCI